VALPLLDLGREPTLGARTKPDRLRKIALGDQMPNLGAPQPDELRQLAQPNYAL
jgi:hypothetical protein